LLLLLLLPVLGLKQLAQGLVHLCIHCHQPTPVRRAMVVVPGHPVVTHPDISLTAMACAEH
jgi:hypothetical protein